MRLSLGGSVMTNSQDEVKHALLTILNIMVEEFAPLWSPSMSVARSINQNSHTWGATYTIKVECLSPALQRYVKSVDHIPAQHSQLPCWCDKGSCVRKCD